MSEVRPWADMTLSRPRELDPDTARFVAEAQSELAAHRGGAALIEDLGSVEAVCGRSGLVLARQDGVPVAVAISEGGVLKALYVAPGRRRAGVARSLLMRLLASPDPPRDGWSLPGDRATKSLYESLGWKARLLTMRAEERDGEAP